MKKHNPGAFQRSLVGIACMGTALAIVVYIFLSQWGQQHIREELQFRAYGHAQAIKKELQRIENIIADKRSVIELARTDHLKMSEGAVHDVSRDDFLHLIPGEDALVASLWLEPKPEHNTAQSKTWFVLSAESTSGFHVQRAIPVDRPIKVQPRFWLQSLTATDTHGILDIVAFTSSTTAQHFSYSSPPAQTKIDSLVDGALITRWDMGAIVEDALRDVPVSGQDIYLKLIEGDSVYPVYTHMSRSRKAGENELTGYLYRTSAFRFAGSHWQLTFEAAPYFLRFFASRLPATVSIFVLILTLLFLMRQHHLNTQWRHIKHQVSLQTEALRDGEARYAMLIESGHVGVLVIDQDSLILYANSYIEEMLGDTQRHDLLAYIHPDDRDMVRERYARMLRDRIKHVHTNECYLRDNGEKVYAETSASVIDYQGHPAILLFVLDVSRQRMLDRRTQHADRLESLGMLAGGIAHDFNNLLTAVIGHVSLLQMGMPHDSPLHKHVQAIDSASKSAASLANQMLAYSGNGAFSMNRVDISEMIQGMSDFINMSIHKHVRIQYQLSSNSSIDADLSQMRQLVMNLIINAAEAMVVNKAWKQGVLQVRTTSMQAESKFLSQCIGYADIQPGEYVVIEVKDSGCGMSQVTQEKIFDPYFSTKGTGRGLGMSALIGIVRGHRGALHIISEEGKGCCIRVLFPSMNSTPSISNKPSAAVSAPVADIELKGLSVLVIEDELMVQKALAMMLKQIGMNAIFANNGEEGIEAFQRQRVDIAVVLLDLMMPVMGGDECFTHLHRMQADMPVIITSGHSQQTTLQLFAHEPKPLFLQKPYRTRQLKEIICLAIASASKDQQA